MVRSLLSRVLLLFAALALLSSCGGPQIPLVGTVKDAYTGKPVEGAKVSVGEAELTTSPDGRFQASAWSAEDALQVVAPGYESVQIALAQQPGLQKPTPPEATIDTTLRPNRLQGVVSDSYSGKPVLGASVELPGGASVTTDANGAYVLEGVPEQFSLQVSAPGYAAAAVESSRTTTLDSVLRPDVLIGAVTDGVSGKPVVGAKVAYGAASATSGSDGSFRIEGAPEKGTLSVDAAGYEQVTAELAQATSHDIALRSDQLRGTITDAVSGKPVANATVVAGPSLPALATTSTRIDDSTDGSFTLDDLPQQGVVQVLAPGYKKAIAEIKDGRVTADFQLEPFQTKALYVTAAIGAAGLLPDYLDIIDRTELNTLIIDLKSDMRDDLGLLYYDSQVPLAKELDLSVPAMDLKKILAECKQRGIYTVARVQLFSHDNALADAKPEWAIQDKTTGKPYSDFPGPGIRYTWLDATNRNVWEYNMQLGEEAGLLGFDEVNYDYIRFPDKSFEEYKDLSFSQPLDPENNPKAMFDTIIGFLKEAHPRMHKAGALVSVDVFGRAVIVPAKPISQDIAQMADYADYVMPMIYPSLWWSGYLELDVPVAEPYKTIYGSLQSGGPMFVGKYGQMRPWLQDHTDPWAPVVVKYGPTEVRAQLDATRDFDPKVGWALYNSANIYTEEALQPER